MSASDDGLPGDAADMNLLIHALADGELDAAAALAVERRIAADPAMAAEYARIVAVRSVVGKVSKPEISDAFLERIAGIGAVQPTQAATRSSEAIPSTQPKARIGTRRSGWSTRNFGSFDWRAMAASIMVSAVLASGATQWVMTSRSSDDIAMAIASGHRRSLLATSPVDVVSSDRHTVKPWLNARLGLSPPAPDLAKEGFTLIGGRVEVLSDRPVPVLVYRHNEHLITLVAQPQEGGSTSDAVDLSAGGFSLVKWSDHAYGYWAISDMERPELDTFVARFRTAAAAI